jgi:hypothetical protein
MQIRRQVFGIERDSERIRRGGKSADKNQEPCHEDCRKQSALKSFHSGGLISIPQ